MTGQDYQRARARQLLLEIAGCPVVEQCKAGAQHPCSKVVSALKDMPLDQHFAPKPWSGDIVRAPLLFVSSNPSLGTGGETDSLAPTLNDSDQAKVSFFDERFVHHIAAGIYNARDGARIGPAAKFWPATRQRAIELFNSPPRPGIDYALTEIVHCPSKSEIGVQDAAAFCTDRYLERVLSVAGARVAVVYGRVASAAVSSCLGIKLNEDNKVQEYAREGRTTTFAWLPHPNARRTRTFAATYSANELSHLRATLASHPVEEASRN